LQSIGAAAKAVPAKPATAMTRVARVNLLKFTAHRFGAGEFEADA